MTTFWGLTLATAKFSTDLAEVAYGRRPAPNKPTNTLRALAMKPILTLVKNPETDDSNCYGYDKIHIYVFNHPERIDVLLPCPARHPLTKR